MKTKAIIIAVITIFSSFLVMSDANAQSVWANWGSLFPVESESDTETEVEHPEGGGYPIVTTITETFSNGDWEKEVITEHSETTSSTETTSSHDDTVVIERTLEFCDVITTIETDEERPGGPGSWPIITTTTTTSTTSPHDGSPPVTVHSTHVEYFYGT